MRFLVLSALAATAACHIGAETNGNQGNAEFSYSNCFLGCATTTPMMLGDEEDVSVTGSIPDGVSVVTTAPSIVSVKSASRSCCKSGADAGTTCRTVALGDACAAGETPSLDIVVDAPAVGSSDLVIKRSDGSTWDAVTLSVERAASLALACNATATPTLAQNDNCPVAWRATDSSGNGLMSTAGIDLKTSNPAVVMLVSDGLLGGTQQSELRATPQLFGGASIVAVGAGDATVTATGGGTTGTLAVHVGP